MTHTDDTCSGPVCEHELTKQVQIYGGPLIVNETIDSLIQHVNINAGMYVYLLKTNYQDGDDI